MGLVKVILTETTRKKLGSAATALCWICVFPSLVLAALGGYIHIVVQEKVKFLQNYNGEALTVFLMCLGVINVCANVIGGQFSHLNIKVRKREKYRQLLFIYNCVSSVLTVCILAAAIACFAHVTHLMESFQTGISSAMALYKSDNVIKEELDDLQITYQCCGSGKYSDWFHVSWINEDYLYAQLAAVKK